MEIVAQAKYIRTSARKVRLVAKALRGLSVQKALVYLEYVGKRATIPLRKTIKSALANAKNNPNLLEDQLRIRKIEVEDGPAYKRIRPISRGQAHSIKKRTSHIRVVLEAPEKEHGS